MKNHSALKIEWKRWIPVVAVLLAVLAVGLVLFSTPDADDGNASAQSTTEVVDARPPERAQSLEDLQARLSEADVESYPELMRDLLAMDDAALRDPMLAQLIQNWLDTDMEGLVAFIDEMEVDAGDAYLWERMSGALATALPMVGDEAASNPRLAEIVRRFVEFTATVNPRTALEWTRQWLLDDALESSLAKICGELAKISPEEAILVLEEIRTPARRVESIQGIGAAYAARDPDAAIQWATNLREIGERPYAVDSVMAELATSDPARAAQEIDAFQAFLAADYASHVMAETGKDPAAALEGDPADLETAPPPSDPRLIILADSNFLIARQWAATSPEEAIAWVAKLPKNRFRDDMAANALAGWARKDPTAALAYFQANERENRAAAKALFESWAASDPVAAAKSIEALESPEQQAPAAEGVAGAWVMRDPERAAAWAGALPEGKPRDVANAVIVDGISIDEPEIAWELARRIGDPYQRRTALETSFAGLLGEDPKFAENALKDARLPESESNLLARMLQSATGSNFHP